MTLGKFIQKFRNQEKITQAEFAKKAGLARSYIARLEKDNFEEGAISLATFIRLSRVLEIPLFQLFQDIKFDKKGNLPPLGLYLQRARKRKK